VIYVIENKNISLVYPCEQVGGGEKKQIDTLKKHLKGISTQK
jgi:hypothetical protein